MSRILVALGGNALQIDGAATAEAQKMVAKSTAEKLVDLVEAGNELIITHGNGPQVGAILLHEETSSSDMVPAMPLETAVAMSQGEIGYWLQQAISNELRSRNIEKDVATVITQTVVRKDDEAFVRPSKPIGPFYTEEIAKNLARDRNWVVKEDAGRGWRRMVPSPKPVDIVEKNMIRKLSDDGTVVIAAGGGGVPVINNDGDLTGVDAVIDKDFSASLLAENIGAELFLILTAVDAVTIGFGTDHEQPLRDVSTAELQKYIVDGEFAPGSMLPKVEAAVRFVNSRPGNVAIITSIEQAKMALAGEAGTWVRGE